ncbi:hypothetical protein EVC27_102 [Rhizobium phage RHph_I1_6]|uniref:Uncharacterized protein n=1 Tax=Rhizobium phage RHph_I1_6 TaxID=2509728 RepID=A0A7S5RN02_9CAUD|nr:hypothetical protein PP745_gp089 [Rhizobium phage RHph_I1_6]QIG76624.1 hypothetical protein EVC27_102 [Rhizobium phage RHph_I1_6]
MVSGFTRIWKTIRVNFCAIFLGVENMTIGDALVHIFNGLVVIAIVLFFLGVFSR